METGSRTILILLGVAALLGLVVLVWNPDYRRTVVAWVGGEPQNSPIWRSNEAYYDGIELDAGAGEGGASNAN